MNRSLKRSVPRERRISDPSKRAKFVAPDPIRFGDQSPPIFKKLLRQVWEHTGLNFVRSPTAMKSSYQI